MNARVRNRVTAGAGALLLALALAVLIAAIAGAAPLTQLQRAHGREAVAYVHAGGTLVAANGAVPGTAVNGPLGGPGRGLVGRGRVPASPTNPAPIGTSWSIDAVLAVLAIGGSVAYAAIATRGSRTGASVTSIGGRAASGDAQSEESRRKAA